MASGIISVGLLLNGFVQLSLLLLCVCALILGVDLAHRLAGATQSLPKDLREFGMTRTVAVDVLTDDDDDDDAIAILATAGGGGLICR